MNWKNRIHILNLRDCDVPYVSICPTRQRIARAFSRLQDIQLVRNQRQDLYFEKPVEERIIWRELLDLELQDVDEQIERISAAAGNGSE